VASAVAAGTARCMKDSTIAMQMVTLPTSVRSFAATVAALSLRHQPEILLGTAHLHCRSRDAYSRRACWPVKASQRRTITSQLLRQQFDRPCLPPYTRNDRRSGPAERK
jgi:hypothetical protein